MKGIDDNGEAWLMCRPLVHPTEETGYREGGEGCEGRGGVVAACSSGLLKRGREGRKGRLARDRNGDLSEQSGSCTCQEECAGR